MAWKSTIASQNGNSVETRCYTKGGSDMTNHDAVVVGPISGSSSIEIQRIRVWRDPRYCITTRTIGSGAVSFRFYAEQMN